MYSTWFSLASLGYCDFSLFDFPPSSANPYSAEIRERCEETALEAVRELPFELRLDSSARVSVDCDFDMADDEREGGIEDKDVLRLTALPSGSAKIPPRSR